MILVLLVSYYLHYLLLIDYLENYKQVTTEYTLEILAYLNDEYLLNNEQKILLEEFYELNDKKELYECIDEFQSRNRRFGGLENKNVK